MIPEVPLPTLRVALRAAVGLLLDLLSAARGEGDFTDAVIVAAIYQANIAPLSGDLAAQRRYAVLETPPPEELLRPISVNAVAVSLGLPFETVRRRVMRLTREGVFEITRRGVTYARAALRSPEHARMLETAYGLVRGFYIRMRDGCLQLMPLPQGAEAFDDPRGPPVRIVWRAGLAYTLRMVEFLLPNMRSLAAAFVILTVVRANTQHLSDEVGGDDSIEGTVADNLRRPATARQVALQLGLPYETARRHLTALVEEGRCVRTPAGFVVPGAVLARPAVTAAVGANFPNLARMFSDLAELGVLARWDAEMGEAGVAA